MLHYHTSYTSNHTDMHKWIGAHTCKQVHTQTHIDRHTFIHTVDFTNIVAMLR